LGAKLFQGPPPEEKETRFFRGQISKGRQRAEYTTLCGCGRDMGETHSTSTPASEEIYFKGRYEEGHPLEVTHQNVDLGCPPFYGINARISGFERLRMNV
jgi:hypothetical protein